MIKRIFSPFVLAARILSFAWKILPALVLLGAGLFAWTRLTKREKGRRRAGAAPLCPVPPQNESPAGQVNASDFPPPEHGAPTGEAAGNWERDSGAL